MKPDERSDAVTIDEMYGEWDYEAAVAVLERSLHPRPSSSLFDTVASIGLDASWVVLDIGGREAGQGLVMAERFGCRVVVVDPVEANLERAARAIADHEYGHLVELRRGTFEHIPAEDGVFDMAFSRDVLGHVADIDRALAECARVLRAGATLVIHGVFAADLLEPAEAQRLCADAAMVPERLSRPGFKQAAETAGFAIEDVDVIGSEWPEASQESGDAPNYLLQVSRLRRDRQGLIEELGEAVYRVMYANALYSIYQLIGKLESRVYVLRAP